MDKEAICWRCNGFFKYDSKDMRPNIWHECSDGMLTATKNPNIKEKKHRHIEEPRLSPHEIDLQNKIALNKRLKAVYGRDILPRLKSWASKDKLDGTQDLSNIVPASTTIAFNGEGLTSCPQALDSGSSSPIFKILIEALMSL